MADDIWIIRLNGRLDATNTPAFEDGALAQIANGRRRLLLDLSELQYVSSIGLRTILVVAKRMTAEGGKLALCSLAPQVSEVFVISGFATILDIHPSAESATASLNAG